MAHNAPQLHQHKQLQAHSSMGKIIFQIIPNSVKCMGTFLVNTWTQNRQPKEKDTKKKNSVWYSSVSVCARAKTIYETFSHIHRSPTDWTTSTRDKKQPVISTSIHNPFSVKGLAFGQQSNIILFGVTILLISFSWALSTSDQVSFSFMK